MSVDVLRKQVVSFEKVKLTNNEMDKSGQVSRWIQQQFCFEDFWKFSYRKWIERGEVSTLSVDLLTLQKQ